MSYINFLIATFSKKQFVIFIIIFSTCTFSWSQNDTLVLKNKDKIIGELKSMDKGVVTIETDYSDQDFKIKWLDIISINSSQTYLITLSNGSRINSTIHTLDNNYGNVTLEIGTLKTVIKISDIVYIKPVESNFFSRITASVSFGFNYTKSNNLNQLSINSSISYTAFKWQLHGSFNSVRSDQDDTDQTQRTDASIGLKYFMKKGDKFYSISGDFLSNDEQKLKLRSTFRTGLGKYFIHSNKLYLGGGFGLAWNNEQFTDDASTNRNSLEAYGSVSLNMFDFDDLSLSTTITLYPSLTENDRYRCDYDLNLKYDLPFDFFIKLGLSYNYDSKPIEDASNSDYVFQSTFGWEFN